MQVLGVDVGGSGIKGAPVDLARGRMTAERHRIPTPQPATPEAVARTVAELVRHFGWKGPIGCGLPAVIKDGTVRTAANISKRWLGVDARRLLARATRCDVSVVNDADAAGYAEMHFGAGRGRAGVVAIVTLGTGIGTALFVNGHLLPNTELGHLEVDGKEGEAFASDRAREAKGLGWKKWARRVETYLGALERYLWPDLIIIGGGVSKNADRFLPRIRTNAPVVAAKLLNEAGIIGAALAYDHERRRARQKLSLG
jgi:polyphosphate glucokinase